MQITRREALPHQAGLHGAEHWDPILILGACSISWGREEILKKAQLKEQGRGMIHGKTSVIFLPPVTRTIVNRPICPLLPIIVQAKSDIRASALLHKKQGGETFKEQMRSGSDASKKEPERRSTGSLKTEPSSKASGARAQFPFHRHACPQPESSTRDG